MVVSGCLWRCETRSPVQREVELDLGMASNNAAVTQTRAWAPAVGSIPLEVGLHRQLFAIHILSSSSTTFWYTHPLFLFILDTAGLL